LLPTSISGGIIVKVTNAYAPNSGSTLYVVHRNHWWRQVRHTARICSHVSEKLTLQPSYGE